MDPEDVDLDQLIRDPIGYAQKKLSVKELEALIYLLKDYYYNTDTPLVPDSIYDQVEEVLRSRSPKSKALAAIGAPSRNAVKLPFPMPSLNKAKAETGVTEKWLNKYPGPYVISHKLDGISALYYLERQRSNQGSDKGSNQESDQRSMGPRLYTRGNGIEGQDISHLLKYLDMGDLTIEQELAEGSEVAIRGELIMSKQTWSKYYESQDNPNVRNFVAGLANAKHPDPQDLKRVQFVAYQLMKPRMKPSDQLETLEELGFHTTPSQSLKKKEDLTEKQLILKLDQARQHGPYQIDGLVVAQDQIFPLTTENPKHSIAFKSQSDEIAQTKVIKVIWRASKRYLLKPTVMIEPVQLSGGTLSKATGHNAKYINDNRIGPGAVVTIVRSGEVIPYIISVDQPAEYPDLPEVDYEWDGFDIRVGEETEEVSQSIILHMAKVLGIENLGPGTIQKVVAMGYASPAEVLNMTAEEWQEVPGLGKNAEKVWNSLTKLQTDGVWLSQLMDASSLFAAGIGQKKMQLVLDEYPDLLEMINDSKLISKLIKIKGVERKTAEKIVEGLPEFQEFLDQVPQIRILDEDSSSLSDEESGNPELKGMRVVFTGVRDKELERLITISGGTVASSVSKSHENQVVIAKDPEGSSNKLKTARDLGLKIYSLTDFKEEFIE